ncbi:hypothetical protein JCGZ_16673 [Jatropha curcas]|uniref:Uncharacterized protein n=1 Tax=Jatropha curcas TaxID=180498 RepID=A0A067KEZ8_JATCU|nr:hypothetical protein JCGZ_16673 [Jatropha curcas]
MVKERNNQKQWSLMPELLASKKESNHGRCVPCSPHHLIILQKDVALEAKALPILPYQSAPLSPSSGIPSSTVPHIDHHSSAPPTVSPASAPPADDPQATPAPSIDPLWSRGACLSKMDG